MKMRVSCKRRSWPPSCASATSMTMSSRASCWLIRCQQLSSSQNLTGHLNVLIFFFWNEHSCEFFLGWNQILMEFTIYFVLLFFRSYAPHVPRAIHTHFDRSLDVYRLAGEAMNNLKKTGFFTLSTCSRNAIHVLPYVLFGNPFHHWLNCITLC